MDGRESAGGQRVTGKRGRAARRDLAALLADLAACDPAACAAVLADDDAEGLRLLDLLGASEVDRLVFLARLRPDAPT